MKKFLAIFVMVLASISSAQAADPTGSKGRWLCSTCELAPPGHSMSLTDITDALEFIKTTVNASLASSNYWKPNDTVVICDGSSCMVLVYQANGNWLPFGPTIKDSGKGYKNGQVTQKVGINSDTATPIGNWYVWFSYWDFSTGYGRVLTPSVTISQGPNISLGFGASFSSGFDLGGGNTSYTYGGDTLAGNTDFYSQEFSGDYNGHKCYSGYCSIYDLP